MSSFFSFLFGGRSARVLNVLFDFENLQVGDLAPLAEHGARFYIFLGKNQARLPTALAKSAHDFGDRVKYIQLADSGRNALDFFIAFYLGELTVRNPKGIYRVVSRDTGYDPLLADLRAKGFDCERVVSLHEIAEKLPARPVAPPPRVVVKRRKPAPAIELPAEDPRIEKVLTVLRRTGERSRPRKLGTLQSHVASLFRNELEEEAVIRLLEALVVKGALRIEKDRVFYKL